MQGETAMAERRMFAKTIIDSDAFLDMPMSSQCLYFHLSMRADDDGFINSPKKIQRIIGAADDDLKLLIAKKFIIPFDSGIVVIKHWKIHNYIRNDRKKETMYPEEMSLLDVKENGAYKLLSEIPVIECADGEEEQSKTARQKAYEKSSLPYSFEYKIKQEFYGEICPVCGCVMASSVDECGISSSNRIPSIQHNVPISKGGEHELGNISVICKQCNITLKDTETGRLNADKVIEKWDEINGTVNCLSDGRQVSDSCLPLGGVGKDRIGQDRLGKDRIDYNGIKDAYNTLCPSLPSVKSLSDARKKAIKARLKSYSLEDLYEAFRLAEESDFLKGKNDRNWTATFDWIIKDANIAKILDGNYQNKTTCSSGKNRAADMLDESYRMMSEWAGGQNG